MNTLEIPEERKTALKSFESLFGGLDMLDHAEKLVTNAASLEAIARMRKVYTALTSYGYEKYVSFDLSMINRFNYYTGIVFRGYTYGTGDAIVKGGRYNSLMEKFGKKAPSVGFAIYVDDLMSAIARNKIDVALDYSNVLVLYKEEDQKEAVDMYRTLVCDMGLKVPVSHVYKRFSIPEPEEGKKPSSRTWWQGLTCWMAVRMMARIRSS